MNALLFKTIKEIRFLLDTNQISPKELYQGTIKNIEKINPSLNAVIECFYEYDLNNKNHYLSHIPFLVKDMIFQKGKIVSAGSKMLLNYVAPYTATVVAKLLSQGAVSVGRANCDEFAMGSTGETSYYGLTRNPWDLSRVPGGSSSGSAAAVSAGLVPFSLGTETGGSVRQPACLCGLTGLKTTYGLHSRYGVIAYASSLDQVGVFTRTAEDAAIVLSATAGNDPYDNTTTLNFTEYNYIKNIDNSIKGKKIAIITNAMHAEGVTDKTKKNLYAAIEVFKSLGVEIQEINLSTMEYSAALYFIISRAEAASNLARFDGVKYGFRAKKYTDLKSMYENTRAEGFGYTVKRRIIVGNYVLAAEHTDEYYNKAKSIQLLMKAEFLNAFKSVDALFCPVTPDVAFKLGDIINNPLAIDLQDYFTAAVNLVGLPALSLQSGLIDDLPIGFQLIGDYFNEETLLQLGHSYQKETIWHTLIPKMENL